MKSRIVSIILLLCLCHHVKAFFDPFSIYTLGAIGSAIVGTKYYDDIKLKSYCKYYECCSSQLIPSNFISFEPAIKKNLFGQQIIIDKLVSSLGSHYKNIENSKKPFVMSFHGTPGIGKNYVANMIAEAVFEKGTKSQYYHVIHGSQYIDERFLGHYREEIKKIIFDGIDKCPYSIFVFDEVDKMPTKIFESLTSMLDHHTTVKAREFTKALFIFLTNYGGESIYKLTHSLLSKGNVYRHELELKHYEELVKQETFGKDGGLGDSSLIKNAVIDFYLPFLPLDESHVIQCILVEFKNSCGYLPTKGTIDEILQEVSFDKITKFSRTGCKTLHNRIKSYC